MSKYKVGDELRIREWDDMATQFGVSSEGHINCKFSFARWMRPMCGKTFTVRSILSDGSFHSLENVERLDGWEYNISEDMLEPRTEDPLYVATDDELKELIGIVY